jgi:flagellar hook-length control protein FliK
VKPLLSQVQNQAHLDDLLGSPKVKGGNFGLATPSPSSSTEKKSNEPSFSDMLLASIHKDNQLKQANTKPPSPKIPDNLPKAERPTPRKESIARPADRPSDLAPPIDLPRKELPTRQAPPQRTAVPDRDSVPMNAVSSASQLSDVPESLTPLKKQLSGKASSDNLLNGNSILAFVAGRLDKLDPESVPNIVGGSLWIKEAVSSQDIAAFMETPMTIGDLSQLLELDQGLLNKASSAGLDPSQVVTPREFISALGLDAGRVTAELKMLQERLPVEGIKPYIDRAKAQAAKANAGVDTAAVDSTMPTQNPLASDTSVGVPSTLGKDPALDSPKTRAPTNKTTAEDISGVAQNIPQAGSLPNLATMNQNIKPANAASSPLAGVGGNLKGRPTTLPTLPQVEDSATKPSFFVDPTEALLAQAMTSGMSIINQGIQSDGSPDLSADRLGDMNAASDQSGFLKDLNASLGAVTPQKTGKDSGLRDLSNEDSEDATLSGGLNPLSLRDHYSEMGREMNPLSSQRIDFGGDGTSQRSIQEHLLARGLNSQTGMLNPDGEPGVLVEQSPLHKSRESVVDLLKNSTADQPSQTLPNALKENLNSNLQAISSLGEKSSGNSSGSSSDQSFGDGEFSDRESSKDMAGLLSERAGDVSVSFASGLQDSAKSRDAGGIFANKMTESTKSGSNESLSAKIFNHAQMMIKNGGGSMRLDMEAPGMGKINVAINLNNNNLDIRIITPSDQARDMITKEVTGLREGLFQQGISLRGLEVGKAGESSSGNFAGQGHQQRGQSGQSGQFGQNARDQRASYNDMADYVQSFKNSYNPRDVRNVPDVTTSTNRWTKNPANGSGRLEIRV